MRQRLSDAKKNNRVYSSPVGKTGRLLPPKHYAVSCVLRNAAADVEPLVPGRMIAPDRGLFFHSDYEKWTGILNTLR